MGRILLIVPVARRSQKPMRFPLGLGYIAASLEKARFSVRILDLNLRRPNEQEEKRLIAEALEGVDAVGIGGMVTMFEDIARIADIVKGVRDLPIVLGGPVTRHFQEIVLRQSKIDYLVAGEGELVAPALFDRVTQAEKPHDVPGVAYLEEDTLVETDSACRIRNLDEIERPAYHLFDFAQYLRNKNGGCDIIASRGCPHQCTFCHRNFGNRVAFRSVDSVLDELAFLKHHYHVRSFYFQDELFIQRHSRAVEFCERLQRQGKIDWGCSTRVDGLSRDLLEVIGPAGCRGIMVGLESFSDSMLREMKKGATVEQNHAACELLNEFGIDIYPGLIIGMPGETEETVREVIAGCKRHGIKLSEWNYAFATPYPGTPLFDEAVRRSLFPDPAAYIDRICEVGDTCDLAFNLSPFDDATLIEMRNRAIRETNGEVSVRRRPNLLARTVRRVSRLLRPSGKASAVAASPAEAAEIRSPDLDLPITAGHFRGGLSREESKALFASTARLVEIEVFSFCNRQCWFCPNSLIDRRSANHYMEDSVYARILADLGEIDFSGKISYSRYNEPLADERIFSALEEASRAVPSATLHLNTNGDYLAGDTVPQLYDSGLRSLHIQVYFSKPGEYDDSIVRKRVEMIEETIGLPFDPVSSVPQQRTEYSFHYRDMHIRAYARNFSQDGTDRGGLVSDLATGRRRTSPCFIPFHDIYIDYNGNVMPCCNLRSDHEAHRPYVIGSLSEADSSLFSVFGSEKAAALRRLLWGFGPKPGPCGGCTFAEVPDSPENRCRIDRVEALLRADEERAAA